MKWSFILQPNNKRYSKDYTALTGTIETGYDEEHSKDHYESFLTVFNEFRYLCLV